MIILLRHGAIEAAKGRFIGDTEMDLSPQGRAQAEELGRALADKGLRALYASPLGRTLDTAAPIARSTGLEIVQVPELAEIHLGDWEGRLIEDVKREEPDAYAARGRNFAEFCPPDGESFRDLQERALIGLEKVSSGPLPCAVVTHSGVIRVLLCHAHGLDVGELFRFEPMPAHAHLFQRSGTGWTTLRENVTAQDLPTFL